MEGADDSKWKIGIMEVVSEGTRADRHDAWSMRGE